MPNRPPPDAHSGKLARSRLKARVRLTRIHDARFGAASFNPTPADRHWGGGRFDATQDDPYAFLYAGRDELCAVAEALLRNLMLLPTGSFVLPKKALSGRWPAIQDGRSLRARLAAAQRSPSPSHSGRCRLFP